MIDTIEVTESGMVFSFPKEDFFHIEKSSVYKSLGNKVKTCEFVARKGNSVVFVEAKSSFPNPAGPKGKKGFDEAIHEIVDKFQCSQWLYSGILVNRPYKETVQMPLKLSLSGIKKVKIIMLLVINGFEEEWMVPIQDELNRKLEKLKKSFLISDILVINHEVAMSHDFVKMVDATS